MFHNACEGDEGGWVKYLNGRSEMNNFHFFILGVVVAEYNRNMALLNS